MTGADPFGYKERLAKAGVTQLDAARDLGWTQSKVFRIVNGQRKRYSFEEKAEFEKWLAEREASAGFRHEGFADTDRYGGFEHERPAAPPAKARPVTIPVYGFAAAGPSGPIHLDHDAVVDHIDRIPAQGVRGDVFALEVWNESMSPRYEPGEIVYCVRNRRPARGRDAVIELHSGDAWLKRYEGERAGIIFTRQLNPEEEVRFKLEDIKALHAVVGRS